MAGADSVGAGGGVSTTNCQTVDHGPYTPLLLRACTIQKYTLSGSAVDELKELAVVCWLISGDPNPLALSTYISYPAAPVTSLQSKLCGVVLRQAE